MYLFLFDIDGTLLHPGPRPREWFGDAISKLTGHTVSLKLEDVRGSTDPLIIEHALQRLGYPRDEINDLKPRILESYVDHMVSDYLHDSAPRYLFPGVVDVLEDLSCRADVVLGLVTGNMEQVARLKLNAFGLWDFFKIGAFASDADLRIELPPIALARAESHYGDVLLPDCSVIVGDTLGDLEAGRHNGMFVVLVGHNSSSDYKVTLKAAAPDYYLDDFTENGLLSALFPPYQPTTMTT